MWIGASDLITDGQYAWTDGVPFTWPSFLTGSQPANNANLNCVAAEGVSVWHVLACSTKHPILCEIDAGRKLH